MSRWNWIGVMVVLTLMSIAIFQNMGSTSAKFLFMTFTMPLSAMLFMTAAVGFGVGFMVVNLLAGKKKANPKSI